MAPDFTPAQLAVLKIVQADLPPSKTPYRDIAKRCGMEEAEVIAFLKSLKDGGVIRRFGASLRHHKTAFRHNAMVAWIADEAEAEKWAPLLMEETAVSHAYFRPSAAEDWPYQLYTMIHARRPDEIEETIERLAASWPFKEYAILETLRELKKTSMTYF